jgi:hypothetical protein
MDATATSYKMMQWHIGRVSSFNLWSVLVGKKTLYLKFLIFLKQREKLTVVFIYNNLWQTYEKFNFSIFILWNFVWVISSLYSKWVKECESRSGMKTVQREVTIVNNFSCHRRTDWFTIFNNIICWGNYMKSILYNENSEKPFHCVKKCTQQKKPWEYFSQWLFNPNPD